MFADDTAVIIADKNIITLTQNLNSEMRKLNEWYKSNKLFLNYDKTKYVIFRTRNKRVPEEIPIFIEQTKLERVHTVKFLGVFINEFLDWKYHIDNVSSKISRNIGILLKLRYFVHYDILLLLFHSLIQSHLKYCNMIWGNTFKTHLMKLSILQKKAMRIITKSKFDTPSLPLFVKMNILPLIEQINMDTLLFMYKLKNIAPTFYFENIFKPNFVYHSYQTRTSRNIHIPLVRTSCALNSTRMQAIKEWNLLSENIKSSSTLTRFKCLCKKYLFNRYVDSCKK